MNIKETIGLLEQGINKLYLLCRAYNPKEDELQLDAYQNVMDLIEQLKIKMDE